MSRSHRKPIIKDKNKFMQKYYNRVERKRAKQELEKGEFEKAEGEHIERGSYDICDYSFDFRYLSERWHEMTDREKHQIQGK